uniref:NADH-ubiquinone oxidoreductase chain 4L n=1 Tax=Synbranchus marmoratus TaxID=181452 RepID=Q8HL85_SYNMA|nr:NADH dehydrogenase subunit 4L [Synbranchus marmoratus]
MTPIHFTFSAMFSLGLMGLTFHRTHLLSTLLCLESMMLSLFIALSMWTLQFNATNLSLSPMLLLAFSACEASCGLALLIATARTHGSDHMQNMNILKC